MLFSSPTSPEKPVNTPSSTPPLEPSKQAAPSPVTVIAQGVRIEGDFGGDGDMRIDGEVSGKLTVGGTLTIGPDANIKAEVKAASLVISGTLDGNITVDQRLDIKSTAKIKGDIKAQAFAVEPGASIQGAVEIGQVSNKPSSPPPIRPTEQKPLVKTPSV